MVTKRALNAFAEPKFCQVELWLFLFYIILVQDLKELIRIQYNDDGIGWKAFILEYDFTFFDFIMKT